MISQSDVSFLEEVAIGEQWQFIFEIANIHIGGKSKAHSQWTRHLTHRIFFE